MDTKILLTLVGLSGALLAAVAFFAQFRILGLMSDMYTEMKGRKTQVDGVAFVVCADVNWGSSGQAHVYRKALKFSLKLLRTEDHIKNFR